MIDHVKFTWEVSFLQERNGLTQTILLERFRQLSEKMAEDFAQQNDLRLMKQSLLVIREATKVVD